MTGALAASEVNSTSYDRVSYPAYPYDYTHPDRLATIAFLRGMQPTPLSQCRVLELGCGDGANLIPIAYQWPASEFIGLDLSGDAIARGNAMAASVGVKNVALHHCDLMQFGAEFGRFDYVIAHGLYSWVPAEAREKILMILGEQLAPNGIAYLSYNCLPGSHLRDLARSIMGYHVRAIDDPRQRTEQARMILASMAEMSASDRIYGKVLRHEAQRVGRLSDEILFHDDLSECHQAFLLADVVAAAARHGLQYLSDATFSRSAAQRLSGRARELLRQFPESEIVARDQYQDFIEGHMFRRTLLCRSSNALSARASSDCLPALYLSCEAGAANSAIDPGADGVAVFKVEGAGELSTDHKLTKAALIELGQNWPMPIAYPALVEAALTRLGKLRDSGIGEQIVALGEILLQACRAGHINVHLHPPKLTTRISERPRASLVARRQADRGTVVTNLLHRIVTLEDAVVRQFLQLVDGTRTVEELVSALRAALKGADRTTEIDVSSESVQQNLHMLARLGLLES